LKLIVGLGNPGAKYAGTRHNVGFRVAEQLAAGAGIALKKAGYQGFYGVGRVAGVEATILLPQTFMNLSGASVGSACKSLGIVPGDLIVIHDDIDLPFGALRIRAGGGHGGHNGIRSIREVLGHGDFVRVKIGVGRPTAGGDVAGYVLSPFPPAERQSLGRVLDEAAAAVTAILSRGVPQAMNEFNNRDSADS
jgi:PTH1 family peptidyl-tRNA hydrolase